MRAPIDADEEDLQAQTQGHGTNQSQDGWSISPKKKWLYRVCGVEQESKLDVQRKTQEELAEEAAEFLKETPQDQRFV